MLVASYFTCAITYRAFYRKSLGLQGDKLWYLFCYSFDTYLICFLVLYLTILTWIFVIFYVL